MCYCLLKGKAVTQVQPHYFKLTPQSAFDCEPLCCSAQLSSSRKKKIHLEKLRRKTNSRDNRTGFKANFKLRRRTRFASQPIAAAAKINGYLIAHTPQKIHIYIFFSWRQQSRGAQIHPQKALSKLFAPWVGWR
jgi:hypothetical protein